MRVLKSLEFWEVKVGFTKLGSHRLMFDGSRADVGRHLAKLCPFG